MSNLLLRWQRCLVVGILTFMMAGNAWSADPPAGAKNSNQQVADTLKEILNRGAALYNDGDRNGCYRLFEGALLALKPQFAHNTELSAIVDKGFREMEQHQSVGERAWALRTALVDVRNKLAIDGLVTRVVNNDLDKDPEIQGLRKRRSALQGKIESYKSFGVDGGNASPLIRSQIRGYEGDLKLVEEQLKRREVELKPRIKASQRAAETTTVRGRVVLDGKPLNDAFIRLTSDEGPGKGYTTKTNETGDYELKEVKHGQYRVSFTTTDPAVVIPAKYRASEKTPITIDVQEGGTPTNIELQSK